MSLRSHGGEAGGRQSWLFGPKSKMRDVLFFSITQLILFFFIKVANILC